MFGTSDTTLDMLFGLAESFLIESLDDRIEAETARAESAERNIARLKKQKTVVVRSMASYRKGQEDSKRKYEEESKKFRKQQRKYHKNAAEAFGGPVMTAPYPIPVAPRRKAG